MTRRTALIVLAACVVPRLVAFWLWPNPMPTYHWELSQSLLHDHVFGFDGRPTTYLEPLYPAVLAGLRVLARDHTPVVLLLQVALTSSAGVLLFLLADRTNGRRAAWAAVCFYACYPYLVRQSVAYLAINLTIPLTFAAAWQLTHVNSWRRAAACGGLLGLLMLAHASFGLPLVAACGWTAWRRRAPLSVAMLAAAVAVQAPWMLRNLRVDGSLLPTRVGENLLVSTSPYADAIVPEYDIDVLVPLVYRETIETLPPDGRRSQRDLDHAMLMRAWRFVVNEPWHAAKLKLRNVLYVFDPRLLPRWTAGGRPGAIALEGPLQLDRLQRRPLLQDLSHALARTLLLVFAAAALWRRRLDPGEEAVLLMAAANALTCVIFFPTTRLLAPASALLMVAAGAGVVRLMPRLSWIGYPRAGEQDV